MGSKQIKDMGLEQAGDVARGDPNHFTVLGVDITREALIALYEGKPTEQAAILGIKQDRRSKVLAPPDFVESCSGGVTEPIHFVRLKKDINGREWLVVDKGNNRTIALRKVNAARAVAGHPPFILRAIQSHRAGSGDAAGLYAREQHALSNVRVRVLPSQNAETAADFVGRGLAPHQVIRYLDGVTTEAGVLELLALHECIDAIKDAVDTGAIKVSAAAKVSKRSEEDQAAWLAARSAPKAPRAKSDAVRPLSPAKVAKLAAEIGKVPSLAPLAALLLGTVRPGDVTDPDLRAACLRAFGDGGAA